MDSPNDNNINYMVCVRCMTYNHAPYIVDAMNGFCMQQTDFPFVCTIIDDASTDGEQEVIHNYLQEYFDLEDKSFVRNEETDDYILTFARHKTNHYCYFAVFYLKYNHYSIKKSKIPYIQEWFDSIKYTALCEGDDYWIDFQKLQKQVVFLESHSEYGMVYGNIYHYIQNKKELKKVSWVKQADFEMLLGGNCISTLTTCFKTKLQKDYFREISQPSDWLMGDYPLWLYFSYKSKIHYMTETMGVYRILENSASHFANNIQKELLFIKNSIDISVFFAEKYMPSKVHSIKKEGIYKYINISLEQNGTFGRDILKLMRDFRCFSPKLFLLALCSLTSWGVTLLKLQRRFRAS